MMILCSQRTNYSLFESRYICFRYLSEDIRPASTQNNIYNRSIILVPYKCMNNRVG